MGIKLLIMDVDGTLTDGNIYMGESGEVCKRFNIKDGYGIHNMLPPENITPVILTGRTSTIVKNRCMELGIKNICQGISDKVKEIISLANGFNCEISQIAYIGDDLNDLLAMKLIKQNGGIVGCPADADKDVTNLADFVSSKGGGNGAVREFIEWILDNRRGGNSGGPYD